MRIGELILKRRLEKHLSQDDLGEMFGVSSSTVGCWERGETECYNYLSKVCQFCEIAVEEALKLGGNTIRKERAGLKKLLQEHGYTYQRLAKAVGVRVDTASDWYSGKSYPKGQNLVKICTLFNISMDEFPTREEATGEQPDDKEPKIETLPAVVKEEPISIDALGLQEKGGRVLVSSRDVARVFGKEHKEVLRTIRGLECSLNFNERNFAPVEYQDSKGETRPEILMTRDGFTFLAMGFTGEKAARFKEAYIAAFNQMEARLKASLPMTAKDLTNPDQLLEILNNWKADRDKLKRLEQQQKKDESKVSFAESVQRQDKEGYFPFSYLAKLLNQNGVDLGRNRLLAEMRKDGFLMRKGTFARKYNEPVQTAVESGWFVVSYETPKYKDGKVILNSHGEPLPARPYTKITPKGIYYFMTFYLRKYGKLTQHESYNEQLPVFSDEETEDDDE